MIKQKTTILTGAGASADYNLPIGSRLIYDIVKASEFPDRLVIPEVNIASLEKLRTRLLDSNTPSIDLFLENNPDLLIPGKYMIAHSLLHKEAAWYLDQFSSVASNWLSFIWHQMIENVKSVEDFQQNKISFITFNYDRTIEAFLLKSIRGFFGVDHKRAVEILSPINIVHLYGHLGNYESLNHKNEHNIPYESREKMLEDHMRRRVFHWSQNITTIDTRPTSDSFKDSTKLLQDSRRVIILGFGYDQTNMERLNLVTISKNRDVFSTKIGMREGKEAYLRDLFEERVQLHTEDILGLLHKVF